MCENTSPWDWKQRKPITQPVSFSPEVVMILRFSPLPSVLSPTSSAGRQKEVRRRRKSFFSYLFMDIPFSIHAFFQGYLGAEENSLPLRRLGPKIRFQLQWAQRMKGRERERGRGKGFYVFSSKWEAGLEGDRLCLLLICQAVNGERRGEETGEQSCRADGHDS